MVGVAIAEAVHLDDICWVKKSGRHCHDVISDYRKTKTARRGEVRAKDLMADDFFFGSVKNHYGKGYYSF